MRISLDLDDTLICYGGGVACEPRLPWFIRLLIADEPLRLGTRRLASSLEDGGDELWVYTTSGRRPRAVRRWLHAHGIRVKRVINETEHAKYSGRGSAPSKRPHAFGIDLRVDDSEGVAIEGRDHGFRVCVVDRADPDWVARVLTSVGEIRSTI